MHACIGEGNSNPLQYSCLENPREGGACWAAVYGVAQSWTWLKRLSSSSNKRDVCSYDGLKSLPPIVLGQWVQTQQMRKNHLSFFGNYKTSPEKWKTTFTGIVFRILSKFQQMPTLGHFSILRNCDENQILQVTFFFFFYHKEGFLLQRNTPMIWLFTSPQIMTRVFTHAWSSPPLFFTLVSAITLGAPGPWGPFIPLSPGSGVFSFLPESPGMWDLKFPDQGSNPYLPAEKAWSPNHWTTREVSWVSLENPCQLFALINSHPLE